MRIVREPFPSVISTGSVVTIGKFDGVHLGHRAVLARIIEHARRLGVESAVVTFDRNPLAILAPDRCPPQIVALERRLELLGEAGVDVTAVIHFDEPRARQPAEEFVRGVLVRRLGAKALYVGRDFRFGGGGRGDVALLRRMGQELGFEVIEMDLVGADGEERVSSSSIRRRILEGDVRGASRLLGSPPAVLGEVVHGHARGRDLGFPTANLGPDAIGTMPADGVYAGWALVDGERIPAAISVSDNPTFHDVPRRLVEAHLIDRELDLYGHWIQVEFVERLRGIERFDGIDELVSAMHDDVAQARSVLGLAESR